MSSARILTDTAKPVTIGTNFTFMYSLILHASSAGEVISSGDVHPTRGWLVQVLQGS